MRLGAYLPPFVRDKARHRPGKSLRARSISGSKVWADFAARFGAAITVRRGKTPGAFGI